MADRRCLAVTGAAATRLQLVMERRKRVCSVTEAVSEHDDSKEQPAFGAARPTARERLFASELIAQMRRASLQPPLLKGEPKVEVAALALALYFGQELGSDRAAKRLFNVGNGTDVKNDW